MATQTEHRRLTKYLRKVIKDDPCSIEAFVADILLDHDNPCEYLNDILQYGCKCGCVPEMVFYSDTRDFFDRHYDEIDEIRQDWEDNIGQPIEIKGDLKNFLSWFAFEHTAWKIERETGLDC